MITEQARFEKRHVLYCDILGFSQYSQSQFFEEDRCLRLFNQFDKMISDASIEINPMAEDPITGRVPSYIVKPEIIYCSDSIAISTPASNYDAMWLCEAASHVQNGICSHGFLVRGAITTGNLYHSGNTIFGPAIANAVALEKSEWRPVIVLGEDTFDIFSHAATEEDREIVEIWKRRLIVEEVNKRFIDPFRMVKIGIHQKNLHPANLMRLTVWRTRIESGLKQKQPKVREKYGWLAERFNQILCGQPSEIKPIIVPKAVEE